MEHFLTYSKPADAFIEALVLGNGSLGATVYGGVGTDRISLNHDTFWSGCPTAHLKEGAFEAFCEARELILKGEIAEGQRIIESRFNSRYSQAYEPVGNFYIKASHEAYTDYRRTLSLEDAILRVEYRTDLGAASREYFVSYPAGAMLMHLQSEFPEDYVLAFDTQMKHYRISATGDTLTMCGKAPFCVYARTHIPEGETEQILWDGDKETISFTAAIRVKTDGKVCQDTDTLRIEGAREVTVALAIHTSFLSYSLPPTAEHTAQAHAKLASLITKAYDTHKREHIEDYGALYRRVRLDLSSPPDLRDTDERLRCKDGTNGLYELLFNFGRYLTIASSREGSQATTLQGIWNEELVPPWQSNYTVNINTEMNYWPTLMVNLKECYGPLVSFIEKISDTGRAVARHYYHADGFVSHHNVDLWGMASPVGLKTPKSAVYAFWNLSSGWLCHHLFEYYLYTGDVAFLRDKAFPILCESARFYLDLLVEAPDGRLILTPSTSPENTFQYRGATQAVSRYTAMSQSIVQNLFLDICQSAQILGIENDLVKEIREITPRLSPFTIGTKGQLLEWDFEYEETDPLHRHISHLFGLYPGTLITTERTPELAEACRASLACRGAAGTGWSLSWKLNISAKLKSPALALQFLNRQLTLTRDLGTNMSTGGGTYPNLLDAHPPYQIDGNFGVTAGIAQLLLQCEDEKIKLLPALPDAFRNGSVTGLCAHGDITVDMEWQDGVLTVCRLCAPRDTSVTVQYRGEDTALSLKQNEILEISF